MTNETKIIVVGGGYAGIIAGLRIAGRTKQIKCTITLINALDTFVERPRLHEKATGTPIKGKLIQEMLRGRDIIYVPCLRGHNCFPGKDRPRFDTPPAEIERLLSGFVNIVETGDVQSFLDMLAEDVVLVPDGGGTRGAAIHLTRGKEDGEPYFALFVHGNGRFIQTIYVIAGEKLKQLSATIKMADHPPSPL